MRIELNLPYPPSANSIWRVGRGGAVYKTRKYTEFKREVSRILNATGQKLAGDAYQATIIFFPCDRRRRDADNPVKALFDAITQSGAVWNDDRQVVSFSVTMGAPAETPFTHIVIETLETSYNLSPTHFGGEDKKHKK